MDVAMATNFVTKVAITGFVWTIMTWLLVMEGVWVVGQQNADIVDTLQLRDVAVATIFGFLYMSAHWRHLTNTTESSVCGGNVALCRITLTTYYLNWLPIAFSAC